MSCVDFCCICPNSLHRSVPTHPFSIRWHFLPAGCPLLSIKLSSPCKKDALCPLLHTHTHTHKPHTPWTQRDRHLQSVCHLFCWHLRPRGIVGETAICCRRGWIGRGQAGAMHHAALFCWSELCEVLCCSGVLVVLSPVGVTQLKQYSYKKQLNLVLHLISYKCNCEVIATMLKVIVASLEGTNAFFFHSTCANYAKAMSHTECFGFIKTTCKRLPFVKLNSLLIILEMFTPLHRETAHECLIDMTVAAKFLQLSWQGYDCCLLIHSRSLSF